MASRTLLVASSECSMTLGGGKSGTSGGGEAFGGAADLAFATGTGLIRLGGAGESVDWRRRAEGLITEFERMRVPYWCWTECWGVASGGERDGVAAGASMRRRSLEVERARCSRRRPARGVVCGGDYMRGL